MGSAVVFSLYFPLYFLWMDTSLGGGFESIGILHRLPPATPLPKLCTFKVTCLLRLISVGLEQPLGWFRKLSAHLPLVSILWNKNLNKLTTRMWAQSQKQLERKQGRIDRENLMQGETDDDCHILSPTIGPPCWQGC